SSLSLRFRLAGGLFRDGLLRSRSGFSGSRFFRRGGLLRGRGPGLLRQSGFRRPVGRLRLLLVGRRLVCRGRRGLLLFHDGHVRCWGNRFLGAAQLLVLEAEILVLGGGPRGRGRTERRRRQRSSLARHAGRRPERIVEIVLGHVQRDVHRRRDLADEQVARIVVQLALLLRQRPHARERV